MSSPSAPSPSPSPPSPPPDSHISHPAALAYWASTPATVDGMLGGYPQISLTDLRGSALFLAKLRRGSYASPTAITSPTGSTTGPLARAVDCGAGIGRVTAGFLSKVCTTIDMVEPSERFAAEARRSLDFGSASGDGTAGPGALGEVHVTALQDWRPPPGVEYDLIWNQWCLGHLRDGQLVEYLRRLREGGALREGGWVVVKENLSTDGGGRDRFDELDSSVTRTDDSFRRLFEEGGWRVVRSELQRGFPRGLYPVRFYALQPKA